jgi:hypothetical protein
MKIFQVVLFLYFLSLNTLLSAACSAGACAVSDSSQNAAYPGNAGCDEEDGEDEEDCYYYFYDVDLDNTWLDEATWPSKREDSWYNQLVR